MSAKDGGPVYPTTKHWDENYCDEAGYARTRRVQGLSGGMTLRDYFAAHAPAPQYSMPFEDHVAYRYRYADAMLAERNKP